MSRQYISTFRHKLNFNKEEKLKPKEKKCSFYQAKTPSFLTNTRKQSTSSVKVEKTEEISEKQRSGRARASVEVERNKIQVEILESALASLRLKERRALRELEKEMRKYRKTADRNEIQRQRQANYCCNRRWESFFPPIENEDEVILTSTDGIRKNAAQPVQLSPCSLR